MGLNRTLRGGKWLKGVLGLACSLSLVACGGDSEPQPTPTAESTTQPTAASTTQAQAPLEVRPPVWSTGVDPADGSPVDSIEWVATDAPVVYAVFETTAIPAGTSFSIAWTMNGTPVPGLNPTLAMRVDAPAGWIEFHLDRTSETPWPEGVLEIKLTVDGEVVSTGSIELRDP
jgi:hypothetical protein